jgi:hypothetical protein
MVQHPFEFRAEVTADMWAMHGYVYAVDVPVLGVVRIHDVTIRDGCIRHVSVDGMVTEVRFALPEEVGDVGDEAVHVSATPKNSVRVSVDHPVHRDWERIVRRLCEACTLGDPAAWRLAWQDLEDLTLRHLARTGALEARVRALTDSTSLGPDEAGAVAARAALEEPGWSQGACCIALFQAHSEAVAETFEKSLIESRQGILEVLDLLLARCDLTRDDVLEMCITGLVHHFESSTPEVEQALHAEWPIIAYNEYPDFGKFRMHRKIAERFGIKQGDFGPLRVTNYTPFPVGQRPYVDTDIMHGPFF